jgi:hypothetical protein
MKKLSARERADLLAVLKTRFETHMSRHRDIEWSGVESALAESDESLQSLAQMEKTGGEPDVIGYDRAAREFLFADCSAQSPAGRRSLCYDREALDARKENKPKGSALDVAREMGIELLTEEQYRELQQLEELDTKTSSWIQTPADVRMRGGALYCDRRYGRVFVYHNGAESYYAVRGFRGLLRLRRA